MIKASKPQVLKGWLDPLPGQEAVLEKLALTALSTSSEGHRELRAAILARDYHRLLNWQFHYSSDTCVSDLIESRQAVAFFTKNPDLPIATNPKKVAKDTWNAVESHCCRTNLELQTFWSGDSPPPVKLAFWHARKIIQKILGPCPSIGELRLSFGPGATTSIRKAFACPSNKMAAGLNCSSGFYASPYFADVMGEIPHWLDALGVVPEFGVAMLPWVTISHPKLAFVPKSAKTMRIVTAEPTLNGLVQLGIGKYMTQRLKKAGIDIKDQTINQRLAREGSLTGELATLDLSSASDTLSTELMKLLLPNDWFSLLDATRSRTVQIAELSQPLRTAKFSGMGNGFLFPLETLVFWALAHAHDNRVSAYGDDLIISTQKVDEVVLTLETAGFIINRDKSYADPGVPFRESCGADWFRGIDIRPFYQRGPVTPATLFLLHNFAFRRNLTDMCDVVLGLIPEHMRLYGPDGYGDGHLLSNRWKSTTTRKMVSKGWNGNRFDTYQLGSIRAVTRYPGDWVSPLYSVYISDREPLVPLDLFPRLPASRTRNRTFVHGDLVSGLETHMLPDGRPLWPLPGTSGYKRVSIYTFG